MLPLTALASASETGIKYSNSMPDFNMIWGIALFFAVLFGAYFLIRWFSKHTRFGSAGNIRVLERAVVGRDASILLIQAGSRLMVVGVTKDGMSPLCELPPESVRQPEAQRTPRPRDAERDKSTFLQRFLHNFKIQAGFLPKNTPPMTPGRYPVTDKETPAPAEKTPPQATTHDNDASSFASVLHRIQASPVHFSHNESSDPESPSESARQTEGSGKVSFPGLRINAPVKAARKASVTGPAQPAQKVQAAPESQAAPKTVTPDVGRIIDSLHQLGHIDDGRRVPFPVSAPITISAQKARHVLEERRASQGRDAALSEEDAGPSAFGPPEVIIPLKPLKPRPREENTVWTLNPALTGQDDETDEVAGTAEASTGGTSTGGAFTAETPVSADDLFDVTQFTASADEDRELLKMLDALEDETFAPEEAERRFEPRRTSRSNNNNSPPPETDKLDELFDRVERRSKRYGGSK